MSFQVNDNVKIKQSYKKDKDNEIYNTLEENFNKYYYDFDYPKTLEDDIWNYYSVFGKYLRDQGHGYISNLIKKYISNRKVDELELARVLMDCNLIKRYNKSFTTDIENKKKFEYSIEDGLREAFYINYENNVTLDIKEILYSNKDYIHHKLDQKNKKVYFEIDIKPNENINFTEIISIETTTYGVDKLEFTVQCNSEKNKQILLKDMDEFFLLCVNNKIQALQYFKDSKFKEWLKEKDYSTQLINYDKSILMGGDNLSISLKYFCMLNEVYKIDVMNDYKISKNKPTHNRIKTTNTNANIEPIKENEKVENIKEETNKDSNGSTGEKTFIQKLKKLFGRK